MDNFSKLVAFLRERFPCNRKLVVRRCKMKDHGSTTINNAETQITVCIRHDKEQVMLDTLVHEWGHVLEYDRLGNHGPLWGKFFAEIYSAYCNWAASDQ